MKNFGKKLRTLLVISVLAGTSSVLTAQEVRDVSRASDASADEKFSKLNFNQWVRDFEKQFAPIGRPDVRTGQVFYKGKAIVRVGTTHPSYGKELLVAYERAMLDMQANYILQNYGTLTTQRISELYVDDSENARQFEPVKPPSDDGKFSANVLLNKFLLLIEKDLDDKLEQQGEPKDKVRKMSIEQKKQLYKDNFIKEIVTRAFHNMSGLVPVQTRLFTLSTPNGTRVQVGVIAVQSDKTRQFAEDIRAQRASMIMGTGKPVDAYLPTADAEYLNEFGFRYVYNESGHPVLISYGRWSVSSANPNPTRHLRNIENAQSTARRIAESWIAEFVNSRIQVLDSRTQGSVMEEVAKKISYFENSQKIGTDESLEEIGDTIDKILRSLKTNSEMHLAGTSEIKTWEVVDAGGHIHVGSVIIWTPEQLVSARGGLTVRPGTVPADTKKGGRENRGSRIVNSKDDF